MNILIAGASGQLGCELVRQAQDYNVVIQTPARNQMDITSISETKDIMAKFSPDVMINAAAYTDVDGAETNSEQAFAVNTIGPANLAQCCCEYQIPLLHVSTDFVFDGKKRLAYREEDPIGPLGVYGQSKTRGEEKIRSILAEHIIVRTSWLYGVYRHNFVKTIINLAKEKKEIRVVCDQFGSPTSAADLAAAVLRITSRIEKNSPITWGTYHYCGRGITTWHEFAENILAMAASQASIRTSRVQPITTDQYPTKAQRPAFSALDCSRITKRFDIHPAPWQQSLKATIDRIFSG